MLIRQVPIFPSCFDEYESEYGLQKITHDKYNDNNNNNDTKKHTLLNSSQIEN